MKSAPRKIQTNFNSHTTDELIVQSLAKLDSFALGVSVGTLCGLIIFLVTNLLILKGGAPLGPNLALLGQYFIGYEVTVAGSFVGVFYGFISGFILGWLIAFLRNTVITVYEHFLKLKGNLFAVNDFIDHP
jgi:tetrahydromethanopterin S-methyltransferase subunit B